jgi:hypothetical protein
MALIDMRRGVQDLEIRIVLVLAVLPAAVPAPSRSGDGISAAPRI